MKKLKFKPEDFKVESWGADGIDGKEEAMTAQSIFNRWFKQLESEIRSYNVGQSLLSEDSFRELFNDAIPPQ